MAFMRVLTDLVCQNEVCRLRATHEVRNRRNDLFGRFCEPHAKILVNHLEEVEEREDAERKKQAEKVENANRFYDGG